jgi:hypothetical protein
VSRRVCSITEIVVFIMLSLASILFVKEPRSRKPIEKK